MSEQVKWSNGAREASFTSNSRETGADMQRLIEKQRLTFNRNFVMIIN